MNRSIWTTNFVVANGASKENSLELHTSPAHAVRRSLVTEYLTNHMMFRFYAHLFEHWDLERTGIIKAHRVLRMVLLWEKQRKHGLLLPLR